MPGERAWGRMYSGVHGSAACPAFSPDGGYLALGAGEGCGGERVGVREREVPRCTAVRVPRIRVHSTRTHMHTHMHTQTRTRTRADLGPPSVVLLDTRSWAVVRQWPLACPLAGLAWISSELGVFQESLRPAARLSLCAVPARAAPLVLQVRVCGRGLGLGRVATDVRTCGRPVPLRLCKCQPACNALVQARVVMLAHVCITKS